MNTKKKILELQQQLEELDNLLDITMKHYKHLRIKITDAHIKISELERSYTIESDINENKKNLLSGS